MQLRVSRVTRNGKTHEYAQLVESFRRPDDGMPMHRVVAHLGTLSSTEIENFRAALTASRKGKRVVVARAPAPSAVPAPRILANLRYLDVATLLELWKEWGLPALLDELMPAGRKTDVSPADIVAALTLQRCVAPGSTLYATEWFPSSALPELLAVAASSFNNTRLHRTLDDLDAATPALMSRLPRLYQQRDGVSVSLFLDVTDTWFVGHGPALAERGKTKEGIVQRKVGIVLLCNERGLPLRWEVLAGNCADGPAMTAMLQSVAGLDWVGQAPVVIDRAMGKTAYIRELARLDLRFLTALCVTEFDAYSDAIPHAAFASLAVTSDDAKEVQRLVEQAAKVAQAAGLERAEDNLFVLDLGTVQRPVSDDSASAPAAPAGSPRQAMERCRQIELDLQSGRFSSEAAAGRALGMGKGVTNKYRGLKRLAGDLQREILDGKADGRSLAELLAIARRETPDEQRRAFRALVAAPARSARGRRPSPIPADGATPETDAPFVLEVHAVAYFNPERFVEQRLRYRRRLDEIQSFAKDLNTQLAAPRSRRTRDSVAAVVDRKLRSHDLLEAYQIHIRESTIAARPRYTVELVLDQVEWARRRRYDGFTVLVAHPSLTHSPADLCRLYREKDTVEKDFQTIKSLVELRPVWHRTDAKVRAHVTLCMLALLLERTFKQRLDGRHTARAALELLATCHLNQCAAPAIAYTLTQPTAAQRAILRTVGHERLVDEAEVAARITPRS